MSIVLLSFFAMVLVFAMLIYLTNRILPMLIRRMITGRLEAIEQIVNNREVPEAWIAPFRKRITRQGETVPSDRIGKRAQRKCLAKLDDLIKYTEGFKLADTEETKRLMLDALREQRAAWAAQTPQVWLENALAQPVKDEKSDGEPEA